MILFDTQPGSPPLPHRHWTPLSAAIELEAIGESRPDALRGATGCQTCARSLEELNDWLLALGHSDPRVGAEFVTRHQFLSELLGSAEGHSERLELIESDSLFHHWGLCTLLLEEAVKHRKRFPRLAREMGELAEHVVDRIDPEFYGRSQVAALRLAVLTTCRQL